MNEKLKAVSRWAGGKLKSHAESASNQIYEVTEYVARQDGKLAESAQVAAQAVGARLDKAGSRLALTSKQLSKRLNSESASVAEAARKSVAGNGPSGNLRRSAGVLAGGLTKVAVHTVAATAGAVSLAGKVGASFGRATERSAPALGGGVGGIVRGAADVTSNAVDAAALPASSIEAMRSKLRVLGHAEIQQANLVMGRIAAAQQGRRKAELLDLLVVGGITLSQAVQHPGDVPPNVERAFDLAYPGLTQTESFADVVNRLSTDELVGLVSGVKGKLFEIELVDHLNNGGLPDGFHAAIAESASQPGWDIQITDASGQVSELLQAKATESASYVQQALERYPNIDVTTTSEVHGQLVAMGLAQNVKDSGISEAMLQAKVDAAAQTGSSFDAGNLVPSSIGLAVIALSVFMTKGASLREKGSMFGTRSVKAGAASFVGHAAMAATQTWWLGLIAGVGSSWLTAKGHGKREQYEALRTALNVMTERRHLSANGTPMRFLN